MKYNIKTLAFAIALGTVFPVAVHAQNSTAIFGKTYDDIEWYQYELNFLEKFKFFTQEAVAARNGGITKNIKKLRKLVEKCQ